MGRTGDRRKKLFEMICLEGQQAGLSWITVLKKRENYRNAFHQFDPVAVAAMTEDDVERLVQDAGIIRHRGKIQAIIGNARLSGDGAKRRTVLRICLDVCEQYAANYPGRHARGDPGLHPGVGCAL